MLWATSLAIAPEEISGYSQFPHMQTRIDYCWPLLSNETLQTPLLLILEVNARLKLCTSHLVNQYIILCVVIIKVNICLDLDLSVGKSITRIARHCCAHT